MTKQETIQILQSIEDRAIDFPNMTECDWVAIAAAKRHLTEEPVSEDLGDYINKLSKQFPEVSFAKLSRIAVRVARWKEKEMQSTIELAEDHAMLAGMEKMKEQMMAKAVDAHCFGFQGDALFSFRLPANNYLIGSEVKVIVIKKD